MRVCVDDKICVWCFGIEADFGVRGFSEFRELFLYVGIYVNNVICVGCALACIG